MKRLNLFNMLILIVLIMSNSCKKGDEDPFFSLKSRKARLNGDWILKNVEGFVKAGNGTNTAGKQTFSFSDGKLFLTSGNYISSKTFDLKYSFSKTGTYSHEENNPDNYSQIYTENGEWNFIGKSKEAGRKNKEFITLMRTSFTNSNNNSNSTSTVENFHLQKTLELLRLTNKELKIRHHIKDDATQSSSNPYYEETMLIWTFEKK